MAPDATTDDQHPRVATLVLAAVAALVLVGLAALFVSVLVAPLAILLIFTVGFAAADRFR